jgi:hypothetical protein
MKAVGIILIGMGVALLMFTILSFVQDSNRIISPIPESKGVKVIFTSPASAK